MAKEHCEGNHSAGAAFESGNVYCKHCGVLLYSVMDIDVDPTHDGMIPMEGFDD